MTKQLSLFDIEDHILNVGEIEISDSFSKICRICTEKKPVEDFYLDRGATYSKCKDCCSKYKKLQNTAKKNAPIKPEKCECCGEPVDVWYCDHYPHTDKFRGWLCFKCNTAAGYVGDSYEGAVKLLNYLYQRRI